MSDTTQETTGAPSEDPGAGTPHAPEEEPTTAELAEPSTEKDPGEEPKAPAPKGGEPSHHAVGIGVLDDEDPHED